MKGSLERVVKNAHQLHAEWVSRTNNQFYIRNPRSNCIWLFTSKGILESSIGLVTRWRASKLSLSLYPICFRALFNIGSWYDFVLRMSMYCLQEQELTVEAMLIKEVFWETVNQKVAITQISLLIGQACLLIMSRESSTGWTANDKSWSKLIGLVLGLDVELVGVEM